MINLSKKVLLSSFICFLLLLNSTPIAAFQSNPVPVPEISFTYGTADAPPPGAPFYFTEAYDLKVYHGLNRIDAHAANITMLDTETPYHGIRYQQILTSYLNDHKYDIQFTITEIHISYLDDRIFHLSLINCSYFDGAISEITYDGDNPILTLNFTFHEIKMADHQASNISLTLIHHFLFDWNHTDIKIDILMDFSNFTFNYMPIGSKFSVVIVYSIGFHHNDIPGEPSSVNDTHVVYNAETSEGENITASKLDMGQVFYDFNATGSTKREVQSKIEYTPPAEGEDRGEVKAQHIFSNLTYGETVRIQSDPKITAFHDFALGLRQILIPIILGVSAISIIIVLGFLFIRKRRNKQRIVESPNE